MRILMGLARLQSGMATMFGVPAGSTHEIFKRVAFVPEIKELYPYARADAMIRMTRGFFPRWNHELERHLVERFDLPLRQRCNKLSKGMRSKLALLLAVCGDAAGRAGVRRSLYGFGVSIRGPWHSREYGQALPLTPLGQAIGAEEVLVWAEFAGRILPFSLAASLALWVPGSGRSSCRSRPSSTR